MDGDRSRKGKLSRFITRHPLAVSRPSYRKFIHIILGVLLGTSITCLLFSLQRTISLHHNLQVHLDAEPAARRTELRNLRKRWQPPPSFPLLYQQLRKDLNESLYFFDRPGRLIPLMRLLTEAEKRREHRVNAGRAWLKSQGVVVAATVRDGMSGLPSSAKNLQRLRSLFGASWLVFIENESRDATRSYLYNWTRADPTVTLLGCDTVNSPQPCRLDIRYSSGQQHQPGTGMKRSFLDEVERGLVMSALRNQYLNYIYSNLLDNATLLLVIDPDVSWLDWDLDSIAQGAYYFMAKPRLQQLCAHTTLNANIYDPCTLAFHLNKHYGEDTSYPTVDYYKSLRNAPGDLPPVKVESCFQAFAFYRLAHLGRRRVQYTRSPGEWMCEHNTLSRQLREVYIDPQMRLLVQNANVG